MPRWFAALLTLATLAVVGSLAYVAWTAFSSNTNADFTSEDSSSLEPATLVARVAIADSVPLNHYYNADDQICSVRSPAESAEPPSVTMADADGTVIATATFPEEGGEFQEGLGCLIYVDIEVPEEAFYEVTLVGGPGDLRETQTVDTEQAADLITFEV